MANSAESAPLVQGAGVGYLDRQPAQAGSPQGQCLVEPLRPSLPGGGLVSAAPGPAHTSRRSGW